MSLVSSLALRTPLAPPLTMCPPQTRRTPLHSAAMNGHEAASRVLIDAGAKVNAESNVSLH